MTEQKKPSDSVEEQKIINYPEQSPETREGGTLTMIFLVIWYLVLGAFGVGLLLFVALFVTCMV